MIQVQNLRKAYDSRLAVDDVSFEIPSGTIYGLLGPNGAGKTTTISILVGALDATGGKILFDGEEVHRNSFPLKRKIGYVPQEIALYEDLSPRDNLRFFGGLYGLTGPALDSATKKVLDDVQLSDRANEKIAKFSGGMKRRLNIAVGLLHGPELLVLDEPTVGVDPQSRNQIFDTLVRLNQQGLTILYTSHYMEEVERLCARIAVMDHGKLVAEGTKDELKLVLGQGEVIHAEFEEPPSSALTAQLAAIFPTASFFESSIDIPTDDLTHSLSLLIKTIGSEASLIHLSTKTVTLEDVFLHLTGKELRDGQPQTLKVPS